MQYIHNILITYFVLSAALMKTAAGDRRRKPRSKRIDVEPSPCIRLRTLTDGMICRSEVTLATEEMRDLNNSRWYVDETRTRSTNAATAMSLPR